jgi:endo-1,4-beta-xylanase
MKCHLPVSLLCISLGWQTATAVSQDTPALKNVFKKDFLVGAALTPEQFSESIPGDCEVALIKKQFNSISPENVLKWERIHPWPGQYDFGPADRYVDFGVKNNMFIIGHNLVWHNQTPGWVFTGPPGAPLNREALLQRMRDHIFAVVGRYKGKIKGWDVVNEAVDEDGTLRQSPWLKIIGEDYLLKAYQFAHQADPGAQLYYNDFSMENSPKRAGVIAMIKKLQAQGAPITGIGMQGHYTMDWPAPQDVDATITAFAGLGLKVMITELDINLLPPNGSTVLPDSLQQALAQRYAGLFQVFVKHRRQITRVTFWGVTDADSWLNYIPVAGRTEYPLLFGRGCAPKPAFDAVVAVARGAPPQSSQQ